MYPKLVALDTDDTILTGQLDQNVWGKGLNASTKLADNIEFVNEFVLSDRSNTAIEIRLNKDIPRIVTDILKQGAALAIISTNTSKALCHIALRSFKTEEPKTRAAKSILDCVRYEEVRDEPKTAHFKRIQHESQYNYADMVYFTADLSSKIAHDDLGLTIQNCSSQTGLTWDDYSDGIERWRSLQGLPKSTPLRIAHFNDVYQALEQKVKIDGKEEKIDVTKFATLLNQITEGWRNNGNDGLVIFSGDVFSPSSESGLTRGKHMTTIANGLNIDVAVVGNHEFDFGFPRLKELIEQTSFPWLLSNIIDTTTGNVPVPMKEFVVLERSGLRIGLIGLVEEDWIVTITGWPETFQHRDMEAVGKNLSVLLRDPNGDYKCDLIIALTHSRFPNDISLARALSALSPAAQLNKDISTEHGVDLLLGGHDHVYWISKGVSAWDDYDLETPQPDAKDDQGDVLIVKSGTDFQDLSDVTINLKDAPAASGCVRKKVIHEISGKRLVTRGTTEVNSDMKIIVDDELESIIAARGEPICITEVELDVRSSYIRAQESAIGNWITDCIRHAYDEPLAKLNYGRVDGVIACTGEFRAECVFEPGTITLGNLAAIVPYQDPVVVVQLTANDLWDALESALSKYPVREGRFPAFSGLRVTFDGSKRPGQRVLEVWLLEDTVRTGLDGKPTLHDKEQVLRSSTRKYLIMVGEYMVKGGDGYEILKGKKLVIPAENGQPKSALIRKYLLGAHLLSWTENKLEARNALSPKTLQILLQVEASLPDLPQFPHPVACSCEQCTSIHQLPTSDPNPTQRHGPIVTPDTTTTLQWVTSQLLSSAALSVAESEDVGFLDSYERTRARIIAQRLGSPSGPIHANLRTTRSEDSVGVANQVENEAKVAKESVTKHLPVIHPVVDGRLKNVAVPVLTSPASV